MENFLMLVITLTAFITNLWLSVIMNKYRGINTSGGKVIPFCKTSEDEKIWEIPLYVYISQLPFAGLVANNSNLLDISYLTTFHVAVLYTILSGPVFIMLKSLECIWKSK